MDLLNIMSQDQISTDEKVKQLRQELGEYLHSKTILRCRSMGDLVKQTMRCALKPYLSRIQKNLGKISND